MNATRPEWTGRRSGSLPVQDRTVLKLSMANIYGNGADCVAWAAFGRRLSGREIQDLKDRLAYYKRELLHGMHIDTKDWDELSAIEEAVKDVSKKHRVPYHLSADLVEAEIEF